MWGAEGSFYATDRVSVRDGSRCPTIQVALPNDTRRKKLVIPVLFQSINRMKNMLNSMDLRELFVKKSILSPQEGDFCSKCRLEEKTKSGKYDIKKGFSITL